MPQRNPQDVASRWATRLGAATDKIRTGVQSVTTAPSQSAVNSAATWQARVSSNEALQKYKDSLSRVSLADWQNAMMSKGIDRIASGARASQDKFQSFMQQFLPFVEGVAQRVRAMPKATMEDRINRAVAMMRGTSAFRRGG